MTTDAPKHFSNGLRPSSRTRPTAASLAAAGYVAVRVPAILLVREAANDQRGERARKLGAAR